MQYNKVYRAVCLPVDQKFHIYSVRVQTLTDFCDFFDVEYKNILGYSKTRWLSLMPVVKRIVFVYPVFAL